MPTLTNLTVNYLHPVKEKGIIETGYKTTLRFINDDYLRFNQQNGDFTTDLSHTDILNSTNKFMLFICNIQVGQVLSKSQN